MQLQKLTKEQAAIIGAYTGFCLGDFSGIQEYVEKLLGRPVWTHEFANKDFTDLVKELAKEDLFSICYTGD